MSIKKIIIFTFFIFCISIGNIAFASNWQYIGVTSTNKLGTADVYYDTETIQRTKDTATIWVKQIFNVGFTSLTQAKYYKQEMKIETLYFIVYDKNGSVIFHENVNKSYPIIPNSIGDMTYKHLWNNHQK